MISQSLLRTTRRTTTRFWLVNHGARCYSATARTLQNDEPITEATSQDIPPIKWTTDRLSPQQIAKVDAIFHKILWLDLMETALLTETLNYKMGFTLSEKQRAALERQLEGQQAAADTVRKEEPEETAPKQVDLKLTGFDAASKIKVIKQVRTIAGLGLKEAKELVEGAPKVIQKDLKPEQAQELKDQLEQVGATVEIV